MEPILKGCIQGNDPPGYGSGTVVSVNTTVQECNISPIKRKIVLQIIIGKYWKRTPMEGSDLLQYYLLTLR
ncbi:MAG: hypothetical protein JST36_04890 [Bacteroidetes bacterium]|nr:hypothetical protein [Bacteroidota bacterium]